MLGQSFSLNYLRLFCKFEFPASSNPPPTLKFPPPPHLTHTSFLHLSKFFNRIPSRANFFSLSLTPEMSKNKRSRFISNYFLESQKWSKQAKPKPKEKALSPPPLSLFSLCFCQSLLYLDFNLIYPFQIEWNKFLFHSSESEKISLTLSISSYLLYELWAWLWKI